MKRAVLLVASIVGFVAAHASSQPAAAPATLPDTVAGRRVSSFLDSINSAEGSRLRQLIVEHWSARPEIVLPIEARVERLQGLASDLAPFELLGVAEASDHEITLLVLSKPRGERLRLTFLLEPDGEHKLLGLRVEPAGGDPVPQGPPLTFDGARADIESYLDGLANGDGFSGAVLVARDGKALVERAYGYADRERGIANAVDTKFNLGSINKLFTRIAVAQLAQRGKLALSDPLIKLLPDYPDREIARKITLAQLAAHRSGLGDIFTDRFESLRPSLTTIAAYLPLFVGVPLEFEPGTRERYSNAGYVVLGLVIEKVSGMDYYTYVRKNIFEPAGMTSTDSYPAAAATPNRAIGYTRGGENAPASAPRRANTATLPARGSSAGGGYSTLSDLAKLTGALSRHELADAPWTFWATGGPEPPAAGFPAGARLPPIEIGVAGGSPGMNAALELDGKGGLVVVLSNDDPPAAERAALHLRRVLARLER